MTGISRIIDITFTIIMIIVVGYFYLRERKKSYLATKKLDEEIKMNCKNKQTEKNEENPANE